MSWTGSWAEARLPSLGVQPLSWEECLWGAIPWEGSEVDPEVDQEEAPEEATEVAGADGPSTTSATLDLAEEMEK